jgi:hypothetical protein
MQFCHNEEHPLEAEALVVDETPSTFWFANRIELIGTALLFIGWRQLHQTETFLQKTQRDE